MSTSTDDAATLSASLLLQSPPGQVDAVYHDLSSISGVPSSAFAKLAIGPLTEYNEEQLIAVQGSVLSKEARLRSGEADGDADDEARYVDQRKGISFEVDHKDLKLKAASPLGEPLASKATELRDELDKLLQTYIADHFPDGACSVLVLGQNYKKEERVEEEEVKEEEEEAKETGEAKEESSEEKKEDTEDVPMEADGDEGKDTTKEEEKESAAREAKGERDEEEEKEKPVKAPPQEPVQEPTKIVAHISGNKYNLANYWSGRWRSSYYLTLSPELKMETRSAVQVHYFENGNVQLRTSTPLHPLPLSSSSTTTAASSAAALAKAIVKAIGTSEDSYERDVISRTKEMGEGAFRGLRRTLPVTKQKMDWDKVLYYKLSTELGK